MSPRLAALSDDHGLAGGFQANADEACGQHEARDITLRRQAGVAERTDAILPRGEESHSKSILHQRWHK